MQEISFWVLLASALLIGLSYGAARPAPWTLLSAIALLAFAVTLAVSAARRPPEIDAGLLWPSALASGVFVWAVIQTWLGAVRPPDILAVASAGEAGAVLSLDPRNAWPTLMRMAAYCAAFAVAVEVGGRLRTSRRALEWIGLGLATHAAYGVVAYASGENPLLGEDATIAAESATGAFLNRNHFAFAAVMGLCLNLIALRRRLADADRSRLRAIDLLRGFAERFGWLFLGAAVICGAAIMLSASRAGAALGLFVLVAFVVSPGGGVLRAGGWRVRGLLAGLGLALVGAALMLGGERLWDRAVAPVAANEDRLAIYQTAILVVAERPLTGFGLGAFEEAFRPSAPRAFAEVDWNDAHNLYLELAIELGAPAALAWFLALGLIGARILVGVRRRRRGRDVGAACLIILVAGAAHSAIDFPLQIPSLAMIFAVILGLGWRQSWSSRAAAPVATPLRPARTGRRGGEPEAPGAAEF